jgi:hypothetical protein
VKHQPKPERLEKRHPYTELRNSKRLREKKGGEWTTEEGRHLYSTMIHYLRRGSSSEIMLQSGYELSSEVLNCIETFGVHTEHSRKPLKGFKGKVT